MNTLIQKVLCGAGVLLVGITLALAGGLYFCYNRVIALEGDNKVIRQEVADLTTALGEEVQRGKEVAAVTARLEENDEKRQGQFLQFSRSLNALKQSNTEVRAALAVVVPRVSLTGLRSFGAGANPSSQSGAGAGASNSPNGNPGK